ncbi:hypothetical protein [Nocardia jejuensis]|uniref:hypothetical protein n=1 Tax=Nocardia jejuensis TaxID=328049 RepID=UPI00082F9F7E|nr:hypothetical protein [Nocardia jejuensis]
MTTDHARGSDEQDRAAAGTLAEQQAELVRALVAGAPAPPGFDVGALAATAHALLHKRAAEVSNRFPLLAHGCGPDFTATFMDWAATRPKTTTAADAAAFAKHVGLPPQGSASRRPRGFRRLRRR